MAGVRPCDKSAEILGKAGCVKLQEAVHSASTWHVIPIRQVLGQALLVPVSLQKSKAPEWDPAQDVHEERPGVGPRARMAKKGALWARVLHLQLQISIPEKRAPNGAAGNV